MTARDVIDEAFGGEEWWEANSPFTIHGLVGEDDKAEITFDIHRLRQDDAGYSPGSPWGIITDHVTTERDTEEATERVRELLRDDPPPFK